MKYLAIIILNIGTLMAQSYPGTRETGLANSDASSEGNIFSIFENPAGSAVFENAKVGFFMSPSPFGLQELSTMYFAYSQPTAFGIFSLGIMNFGFKLYRENLFLVGYSIPIDDVFYFGVSVQSKIVQIKNYGSGSVLDISLGSFYRLGSSFKFGFSIKNPLRTAEKALDIPLLYEAGLSYKIPKTGSLNFSIIKETDFPFSPSFGIEFIPADFISLQFGARNNPTIFCAGISAEYEFIKIGFAVESHQVLGLTHQGDIIITIR